MAEGKKTRVLDAPKVTFMLQAGENLTCPQNGAGSTTVRRYTARLMSEFPEPSTTSPGPPMAVAPPSAGKLLATPAAFGWRLLALIYDAIPLLGIWFAVAALMLALRFGQPVEPGGVSAFVEQAWLAAATFGYFAVSFKRGGQTLGMRAWRLRLLSADGGAVSWKQILRRALVSAPSLAVFGLGFLWSLFERERRSWHDLASGTVIVRLPKPDR